MPRPSHVLRNGRLEADGMSLAAPQDATSAGVPAGDLPTSVCLEPIVASLGNKRRVALGSPSETPASYRLNP